MAALDSSVYRRPGMTLAPITPHRRATVGSPPPFSFSNTFEYPRPLSRTERLNADFPYRYRRSTVSGHAHSYSQGHNVNDAPPLGAPQDSVMLSDSASPSPILSNVALLPTASPTPSSSGSPKPPHSSFDYDPPSFPHSIPSPLHSFSLCPSPDFTNHLGHPRTMPPPLLPPSFSSSPSTMRPLTSGGSGGTASTPALSPTASSASFVLDPAIDPSNPASPPLPPEPVLSTMTRDRHETEITPYRHRGRDHDFFDDFHHVPVTDFETPDNKARIQNELGLFGSEVASAGTEQWPAPPDWPARTAARIKHFCGLNRAGNALCAWHDSRRERRAYPPRMAPPNTLNCGCTFEEALFEESLARNKVGAFLPGESVRMDPALRNPLLKLLKERYGYSDGDFERRPDGSWREGEDALSWEQRPSRASSKRDR